MSDLTRETLGMLSPEEEEQLKKEMQTVRNRFMLNKKRRTMEDADLISVKDPEGGFVYKSPSEEWGKDTKAAVNDGKGGYEEVPVEDAVMGKMQPFDYTKLRQDFGDAGSRAKGEIDPALVDSLKSVNLIDGKWYEVDDKGESWTIDDGEKGAMDFMRQGHKPGLGVMSARRIALQRAKNNEEPVNMRLYDMPEIKSSGRLDNLAKSIVEEPELNEPEPTDEDEEMSGPVRSGFTRR